MRLTIDKPQSNFCQPSPKLAVIVQPEDFYVTVENKVKVFPNMAKLKPFLNENPACHSERAVPKTSRRIACVKLGGKIAIMCLTAPLLLPLNLVAIAGCLALLPVGAMVTAGLLLADETAYHVFGKELLRSGRTTAPLIKHCYQIMR